MGNTTGTIQLDLINNRTPEVLYPVKFIIKKKQFLSNNVLTSFKKQPEEIFQLFMTLPAY